MATIFLSYSLKDKDLAEQLESQLDKRGHSFKINVGTPPAGKWRPKLWKALQSSEILIPILSRNGLESPYVASEVGFARALDDTQGMLLLPVVVGVPFHVPSFVADYQCFGLPKDVNKPEDDPVELDRLADELHRAINEHTQELPKTPRIFISHRHKDEAVASALVDLLYAAFVIDDKDIRCTSVQPYTLAPGDRTSERLRVEISRADVVLGLLASDTSDSNYVLAELGASWGCDVPTFPLLIRGAQSEDVPEPLSERHSMSLEKASNGIQLVEEIARVSSLRRKKDALTRVLKKAEDLAKLSQAEQAGEATSS